MKTLLVLIAVITLLTGLVQVVAPGLVLGIIGAAVTPTSGHFFGLVGMLMALFGGALWQAMANPASHRLVLFWSGLQKMGAVAGVGLGVYRHVFSALALGVAAFDLASAVLILYYWNQVNQQKH